MQENDSKFYPNQYYHIYNRGNNKEKIFFEEQNYFYFLNKFDLYLSDNLDVLAFALLPNHFHFLVKTKESINSDDLTFQFRKFFISYSKSINKQFNRTGSLFQKKFKRKLIGDNKYLSRIILYIHANPQKHKFTKDFMTYKLSSFEAIISNKPTRILKEEVIELFGDINQFIRFHKDNIYLYKDLDIIDDDK